MTARGREEPLERGVDRRDAPEGERRGEEGGDLPVVRTARNGVEREADRSRGASRARPPRGRGGATRAPERPGAGGRRLIGPGAYPAEGLFRTRPGALLVACAAVTEKDPDGRAAGPAADRRRTRRSSWGSTAKALSRAEAEDHLDELERLVDTAGGVVVARALQERSSPDSATYVGKGKLKELAEAARGAWSAGWIVFDDELSPSQIAQPREGAPGAGPRPRRTSSSRSSPPAPGRREAMTQVELARLQYLLPRLTGARRGPRRSSGAAAPSARAAARRSSSSTSGRSAGGSRPSRKTSRRSRRSRDVRRRHLQQRRDRLPRRLHERRQDDPLQPPHVLEGVRRGPPLRDARRAPRAPPRRRRPGDRRLRHGRLPAQAPAHPRRLLPLDARRRCEEADLLVHVVDASSPHADEQRRVAEEVLAELGVPLERVLLAYNKTDRPGAVTPAGQIAISAVTGEGLPDLRQSIVARLLSLGVAVPVLGAPPPA